MPCRAFNHASPSFLYQIAVAGTLRSATHWDLMHLVPPPDSVAIPRSDHCPVQQGQQSGRAHRAVSGALAAEEGALARRPATADPATAGTATVATVLQAGAQAGRLTFMTHLAGQP